MKKTALKFDLSNTIDIVGILETIDRMKDTGLLFKVNCRDGSHKTPREIKEIKLNDYYIVFNEKIDVPSITLKEANGTYKIYADSIKNIEVYIK